MVSLVPTTLQRLLDAGLRDAARACAGRCVGGAPVHAGARSGARRAHAVPVAHDVRADRGVLAGDDARRAAVLHAACALAEDGEILVSGPTVAPGAGRCSRPATSARGTPTAILHVVGRKSDTIVTGGENVAPTEVEAVLEGHPAVAEAAVHGAPTREWGEAVVGDRGRARRRLGGGPARPLRRRASASFKVPKAIRFADALPRTRSGKLSAAALIRGRFARVDQSAWTPRRTAPTAASAGRQRRQAGRASARPSSATRSPVSQWLLDAAHLQPGHTVLELAAGPADTGLLAAELVAPGGKAIITDNAEAMIEAATARAEEVGATNVEIRPMEAEWIDLPTASVDAVLCRWGYMLLADPEAALRETRRVLRPGGRVALAAWAGAGARTRGSRRSGA